MSQSINDDERKNAGDRIIHAYALTTLPPLPPRRPDPLGWVRWSEEYAMQRYIRQLPHEDAIRATERQLWVQLKLGDPWPVPIPPVPPPVELKWLRAQGRKIVTDDGPIVLRVVTGFSIPLMISQGRREEARAWMAETRAVGFNTVRMLSCWWWAQFSPESGRAVLDTAFDEAARYGLYAEMIGIVDSALFKMTEASARMHLSAVGETAAAHVNSLAETGNELWDGEQLAVFHDARVQDDLLRHIPAGVLATAGSAAHDEALTPTGRYLTRHLDRGRIMYDQIRRIREFEALSGDTGKPIGDNENIGFDEVPQRGRRSSSPEIAFVQGFLDRIFCAFGTFHYQDGLHCAPIRPVQAKCRAAWMKGSRWIPDEADLQFFNSAVNGGWNDSPVRSHAVTKACRVYTGVWGDRAWTIAFGLLVNPDGTTVDPEVKFGNGWAPVEVTDEYPEVRVYELRRG